jgi:broad specificity phosphatase PhoE
LYILKLPLFLPYKGWTSISRFGWFVGFKRENTESHRQARKRVRLATDFIEEKSKSQKQVVLVAHGFLNRNISHKLSQMGWKIVDKQGKKNLGATVLEK